MQSLLSGKQIQADPILFMQLFTIDLLTSRIHANEQIPAANLLDCCGTMARVGGFRMGM